MNNKINSTINWLTAILVLLLAIGSFTLSFSALQDMASLHGIVGWKSYIWPLLIDLSLVVFSLSVVNAHLQQESTFKKWGLVGIYTIGTLVFNVLHAPQNYQSMVIAAIAPISLFFSFEVLMSQLKSNVVKYGLSQTIKDLQLNLSKIKDEIAEKTGFLSGIESQIETNNDEILKLQTEIETLKTERKNVKQGNYIENPKLIEAIQAETLLTMGKPKNEICEIFDFSYNTLESRLQMVNGNGLQHRLKEMVKN